MTSKGRGRRSLIQVSSGALLVALASAASGQAVAPVSSTTAPPADTTATAAATGQVAGTSNGRRTSIELTAGLGYSSDPFLGTGGDGSVFGRVSAFASHSVVTERNSLSLTAFGENDTYLSGGGSRQIVSLGASDSYRASEKLILSGNVGFSTDFGGQLVGRIISTPVAPPVINPGNILPPPTTIVDPYSFNVNQRQYRFNGAVGADLSLSARDTLNLSASGQYGFYPHASGENYTTLTQTVGWQRRLSERTAAGIRLSVQEANYGGNSGSAVLYNPAVTVQTQLGGGFSANAALGVLVVHRKELGRSDDHVSPSVDASLCRQTENEQICASASHSVQTSNSVGALTTTSASATYFKRLNANDTLQFAAVVQRTNFGDVFNLPGAGRSTYYTASGTYDHRISQRFSVGGELSARDVHQSGTHHPVDITALATARYRLGNIF